MKRFKLKKLSDSLPLLLGLLLSGLAVGFCHAQELESRMQSKEDALASCHIRAELVNLGEPVYWPDLEPCDYLLDAVNEVRLTDYEQLSTLLNRTILYTELTEFDRARADLDRAISVDPLSARVQLNLGVLHLLENNYRDAVENFSLALELGNVRALALYNRAVAYVYMDELDMAVADLLILRSEYPEEFDSWIDAEGSGISAELLTPLAPPEPALEF